LIFDLILHPVKKPDLSSLKLQSGLHIMMESFAL